MASPSNFIRLESLSAIGYESIAAKNLLNRGAITSFEDIRRTINTFQYRTLSTEGGVLRTVSEAIMQGDVTCLEAALLSYDLASLLGYHGRLMVMNRLDPKTNTYLGHTAFIYRASNCMFAAIAVSRYQTQGGRSAKFATEEEVVLSYANGYLNLGLVPLSFGISDISTIDKDINWRRSHEDMLILHERLLETQTNSFQISTMT